MSELKYFLKGNKAERKETRLAVSKAFVDEDGEPILWTIRPLNTRQNEAIMDECLTVKNEGGRMVHKLDNNKYLAKIAVACIVEPNLYSKDLQDSYGVMTPEDLLREMLDDPVEYQTLVNFVQSYNGLNVTLADKVETAKN